MLSEYSDEPWSEDEFGPHDEDELVSRCQGVSRKSDADNLAEARAYLAWRAPLVANPGPEPEDGWADSSVPLRWLTAALAEVERLRAHEADARLGAAVRKQGMCALGYAPNRWWSVWNTGDVGPRCLGRGPTPEAAMISAGLMDAKEANDAE